MESVLVPVLEQIISQALGSSNFAEILQTQLPQVVSIICQFVETSVIPLYHTVAGDIKSYVKHSTALNFLDQLFIKFTGSTLGKDVKMLVSQFIPVIISASKGELALNQNAKLVHPIPTPTTAPTNVYISPDPPALATTAETTSSAPPIPAKKGFLRRNASVKQ